MKTISRSVAAMTLVAAAVASSPSSAGQPSRMMLHGPTSQPIGHYEFCQQYADECRPSGPLGVIKLTSATWSKLIEVNRTVNTAIIPRTDQDIYGVPEKWAYPTTEGDCEDYVLLKQYMLEREGFPRSALLITVVRQTSGDGHAVLTVRTDAGEFILDNLDNEILPWAQTPYIYLKRQAENNPSRWTSIEDDRNLLVGSVR
ncbi:Predicted transglutaminase-like cysteine proteinase [Consotaella salsifontis]|uniref:Predicted transglutaminase-like cysteine proteinase n=1 Tax=Consotaella salsifontis TaxID=1365950 RepID=A0A1T4L790_9HYPH|nr:Predicted transglutaminase-like cysteine proteinase [Consotaella salsifontis]